ncbi:MAG: SBBP repeat-containing protein [Anaerolineae bacterium]|nr:SBBP repeat-containing protein [Anaerolineae bacterium]
MSKRGQSAGAFTLIAILIASAVFSMGRATTDAQGVAQPHEQSPQSAIQQGYGQLPLSFVPNVGQTDAAAQFQVNGLGGTLFFTPEEVVLSLPQAKKRADRANPEQRIAMLEHDTPTVSEPPLVVKMHLIGANTAAEIAGTDRLPGIVNYFIGNDPSKWHTNISTYAGIVYRNVYPGIDLQYNGHEGRLKGTYTVAAGADPSVIGWRYAGNAGLSVDDQTGDLLIMLTNGSVLREVAPTAWQDKAGKREAVETRYMVDGEDVRFGIGAYDARLPLVIDPEFVYSTYLGGSDLDSGYGIAVDNSGNVYVSGMTYSSDFPLRNPFQATGDETDTFVTKLNAAGNQFLYSTFLGGSWYETARAIAVDSSGNAYITGETESSDFPTRNPFQPAHIGMRDAFVAKLNTTNGDLIYSTYLGGLIDDYAYGIAVDSNANVYITGRTDSPDFPVENAFQPTFRDGGRPDAFVSKLNASGNALIYSTFLGGGYTDNGNAIAVDASGSAYIAGTTESSDFPTQNPLQAANVSGNAIFITKLTPTGNTLVFSTYLGGSSMEEGRGIALDSSGNIYITGLTGSPDFPTVNAFQPTFAGGSLFDAFVAKLNATGSALVYSTYLGGSGDDIGNGIAVDSIGNAYVAGETYSRDFPILDALQATNAGIYNAFVTKLNVTGATLGYSTYLGGNYKDQGFAIAVDGNSNVYVTGATISDDFPEVNPIHAGGVPDAFVVKIRDTVLGTSTPTLTKTQTLTKTPTATASNTVTPTVTVTSSLTLTRSPTSSATVVPPNCELVYFAGLQIIDPTEDNMLRLSFRNDNIQTGILTAVYLRWRTNPSSPNMYPNKMVLGASPNDPEHWNLAVSGLPAETDGNLDVNSTSPGWSNAGGRTDVIGNSVLSWRVQMTNFSGTLASNFTIYDFGGTRLTVDFPGTGVTCELAMSGFATPTQRPSQTPTATHTATIQATVTASPTTTPSTTPSATMTASPTSTPSVTASVTHTPTATVEPPNCQLLYITSVALVDPFVVDAFHLSFRNDGTQTGILTAVSLQWNRSAISPNMYPNKMVLGASPNDPEHWSVAVSGLPGDTDGSIDVNSASFGWSSAGNRTDVHSSSTNTWHVQFTNLNGSLAENLTVNDFSVMLTISFPGTGTVCHLSFGGIITTPTPSPTTTTVPTAHPDTIGIFRPSTSTFYLRNSNTTGFADSQITFGTSSYFPITGDWNGDGIDTAGVYESSTGQFFLTNSTANPAVLSYSFVLGNPGDQPIVGDWDGDGRDGVGVFRPSNGLIYLKNSLTTGFADFTMVLGVPGDVGIAGDWNGDGKDSPGVYRPSNQVFYLSNAICNCSVFADAELGLGIAGDTPFVGDWDGDGKSGVGVYRQSNGLTYIKNALTTGFADSSFVFGSASDYPLAGYWVRVAAPVGGEPAPTFMP